MADDHTERRRSQRFPVTAPVIVSWKAHNGARRNLQGTTRDICLNGMYVASRGAPPVASIVRCEVLLPELQGAEPPASRFVLQAVGRVVRTTEHDGNGFGISTRASVLADAQARPETAPMSLER